MDSLSDWEVEYVRQLAAGRYAHGTPLAKAFADAVAEYFDLRASLGDGLPIPGGRSVTWGGVGAPHMHLDATSGSAQEP